MMACDDLRRQAIPRIGIERALQFGGLGIGALFAYFSNPVTMERLHAMVPALLGSSVVLALAVVDRGGPTDFRPLVPTASRAPDPRPAAPRPDRFSAPC